MSRPRVAWASPLPPSVSGIADYAAEILPALAERVDLTLVLPPDEPVDRTIRERFATAGVAKLYESANAFDVVLYHVGNHGGHHGWILEALKRRSGLVVLHEVVLHHMLRELTLAAGFPAAYVEELRYAYGDLGEAVGRRAVEHGVPADPWMFPLFERVADLSRGVLVHSETARRRFARARPLVPAWRVPHPVLGMALGGVRGEERATARRRFGWSPEAFVVGTFGSLTATKRPEVLLRAFAAVRRELPSARCVVAGGVDRSLARDGWLERAAACGVEVLGRLDLEAFQAAISAVDVAVNLRWPSGGETSGALLRLLAAGRATLVSDAGSFAEIPDGCAIKVPVGSVDADEETAVVEDTLLALARDPRLREALEHNARQFVASEHSLAQTVAAYERAIRACWSSGGSPFDAAPPLLRAAAGDLLAPLTARFADDLCALGFTEEDSWAQTEVARVVVDLDLDGPGDRDRAHGVASGPRRSSSAS